MPGVNKPLALTELSDAPRGAQLPRQGRGHAADD